MGNVHEIVKVQRPLSSNDPKAGNLVLIYAKDHRYQWQGEAPEVVAMLKKMGKVKAYFDAELIDTKWVLGKRVKDRSW